MIAGVDDQVNDGDVAYTVTCAITSGDLLYAGVVPIAISAVNLDNEEGLTLPSGVLFYAVGMPPVGLDGRATVVDPDVPNYDSGSLTVTLTANGTGDDRLEIRNSGIGPGQIGVSGGNVTYGGAVVGTFVGGLGATPLVVTFTTAMNRAAAEALVRSDHVPERKQPSFPGHAHGERRAFRWKQPRQQRHQEHLDRAIACLRLPGGSGWRLRSLYGCHQPRVVSGQSEHAVIPPATAQRAFGLTGRITRMPVSVLLRFDNISAAARARSLPMPSSFRQSSCSTPTMPVMAVPSTGCSGPGTRRPTHGIR